VATDSSFEAAFARACQGSDADLQHLLDEYGAYIQRVVRSRLDTRLRPKFDSLDFVQMVWASFFAQPGALMRFNNNPRQLLKYLATMARNKVVDEERRRLSDNNRYRATGEQFLGEHDSEVAERRSDTPSQCAIARERLQLLESTDSEQEREIMKLRMRGLSYIEIAARLGINERTVRKIVDRLLE